MAQRAATSPLLVNVTRQKSVGASQQLSLKITVRNMSKNDVQVGIEALFVGELVFRGNQETIYCERKTSAELKAGESRDFVTESDTTYTQPLGPGVISRSNYVKPKGYITRVLAGGQLVNVDATVPSLQKMAWDERTLDKLRQLPGVGSVAEVADVRPRPAVSHDDITTAASTRMAPASGRHATGTSETRIESVVSAAMNGLVAYYRLDETSGATTAADATGGGHDGYFIGGATPGVKGQLLQSVDLDRTARSHVRIDMPLNLNANTVTLSAWVRRRGDQADFAAIVFSRNVSTVAGLHLGKQNGLRYTWNGTADTYNWSSRLDLPDGVWAFTALVIEPEQATVYLGVPGGEMKTAVHHAHHDVEEFDGVTAIGRDPNQPTRFFDGQVDEVGIWKRSLARDEIDALFEQGMNGGRMQVPAGQLASTEPARVIQRPGPAEAPRSPAGIAAATVQPSALPASTMQKPASLASYQEVASLYNKTIATYQDYLQTRKNPASLRIIEDTLRVCAEGFDDFRKDAPADANIDSLIEQCNRAIFAVHATRLAPE